MHQQNTYHNPHTDIIINSDFQINTFDIFYHQGAACSLNITNVLSHSRWQKKTVDEHNPLPPKKQLSLKTENKKKGYKNVTSRELSNWNCDRQMRMWMGSEMNCTSTGCRKQRMISNRNEKCLWDVHFQWLILKITHARSDINHNTYSHTNTTFITSESFG